MLKIKYVLILAIIALVSCDNMNQWHQEYIDAGETVYAGAFDSVYVYSGYQQVKVDISPKGDSRLRGTVIVDATGSHRDTVWFDLDIPQDVYTAYVPLDEGSYQLEFTNFDIYGNLSIPLYKSAHAYGESYESNLISQVVRSVDSIGDSAIITWVDMDECVGNRLVYETSAGIQNTIDVFFTEGTTGLVPDPKFGSTFKFYTYYCPDSAIDTVMMEESAEGIFPLE